MADDTAAVLADLVAREPLFHRTEQLSSQVSLLTYTLRQGDRVTLRATVWERVGDSWRAVYHQGTLAAGDT